MTAGSEAEKQTEGPIFCFCKQATIPRNMRKLSKELKNKSRARTNIMHHIPPYSNSENIGRKPTFLRLFQQLVCLLEWFFKLFISRSFQGTTLGNLFGCQRPKKRKLLSAGRNWRETTYDQMLRSRCFLYLVKTVGGNEGFIAGPCFVIASILGNICGNCGHDDN